MNIGKKCLLMASVPVLLSCGETTIAGTYGFQLGKDNGTHFGASLTLLDEPFVSQTKKDVKKFELLISAKTGTGEEESTLSSILDYFRDEQGNAKMLGYYKQTDVYSKSGENLLVFGLDFSYIFDRFTTIYEEQTGNELLMTEEDLAVLDDSKIIDNLLYSTYAKETVNLFVPVSVEDAILQLYWYGVDVRIDLLAAAAMIINPDEKSSEEGQSSQGGESSNPSEGEDESSFIQVYDVKAHEPWVAPTEADIAEINKEYEKTHSTCIVTKFRAFHQVKLGLGKKN